MEMFFKFEGQEYRVMPGFNLDTREEYHVIFEIPSWLKITPTDHPVLHRRLCRAIDDHERAVREEQEARLQNARMEARDSLLRGYLVKVGKHPEVPEFPTNKL